MFFTAKKNYFVMLAVLLAVIAALCVAGVGVYAQASLSDSLIDQVTVVIDAGHGGYDGGVVGSQGVKESDINLKMATILQSQLESRGINVVMTRTTPEALDKAKRLDMQARRDIIRSASPAAVISLHVNKFSDTSRRGAQVFYDDTGVGKDFALVMQERINKNINAKYSGRDDYEAIAGDLYITKCAPVPSLIIECGFISNHEDEKLLLSQDYCNELCANIADVVCESCGDTPTVAASEQGSSPASLGDLTILMYHNTLAEGKKESVYCINANSLRADFEYLKGNGYTVISCKSLIEYVDDGKQLPDKAVLLTFDDGYLNNKTYALPLLEEYGYVGLFSVVGDFTLLNKTSRKGDFTYFGWDDIAEVAGSPYAEIGLHSYSMHNTRPRMGVGQLVGEDDATYEQVFAADTQKLADKLAELGVYTNIYAYPYGKYTKISETVLKDMDVAITLTCNEGINHILGRRSLYLLKRINRDATKSSLYDILAKYE